MSVVSIMRLPGFDPSIALPDYATDLAAGADIRANFDGEARDGVTLAPGERRLIPTGFAVAIEPGFEMQIRPRSGLALKHGIALVNAPGTVDADYRGAVGVILINLGDAPVMIAHGDRIAQAVIAPVVRADFAEVMTLDDTERGAGGLGSTGRA